MCGRKGVLSVSALRHTYCGPTAKACSVLCDVDSLSSHTVIESGVLFADLPDTSVLGPVGLVSV